MVTFHSALEALNINVLNLSPLETENGVVEDTEKKDEVSW